MARTISAASLSLRYLSRALALDDPHRRHRGHRIDGGGGDLEPGGKVRETDVSCHGLAAGIRVVHRREIR